MSMSINCHKPYGPYERWVKRPLDCVLAGVALVGLSPVLAAAAVAVRIKLGSPVFFRQPRPGKNEKVFNLYKFRTMTDERDENGNLLPDSQRLTKFGHALRTTSIDELPELINIVRGDMSIVGPRPLLTSYLPYYTEEERHRHDVRPGLTGLSQINGRNYLMWDERLRLDVDYADRITFLGDARIIAKTAIKVLKRADVAAERIPPLSEVREDNSKE